uniref:KIND domain-containing protein n=1 Tax=Steinernema glaseri TaxID=37863 RepID=A0A1I8A4D4_9BILA
MAAGDGIRVSISEISEVRGDGLEAHELLSVIYAAAEFLLRTKPGVFSSDHLFITPDGTIHVNVVTPEEVEEDFVPPEGENGRNNPGATHVWCLGKVAQRAGASTCKDVDLFSLLNLMTVQSPSSRPSLQKLVQMTRNKIGDVEAVPSVLMELYVEVMGDDDDLNDRSSCSSLSETSSVENKVAVTTSAAPALPIPFGHKNHSNSFSSHNDSDFDSHNEETTNNARIHSKPSTSSDPEEERPAVLQTKKAEITHSPTDSFEEMFDRVQSDKGKSRKTLVQPIEMLMGKTSPSSRLYDDNEFAIVRVASEDDLVNDAFQDDIVKAPSPERTPQTSNQTEFGFSTSTPQRTPLSSTLPPVDEDQPLSPISETSEESGSRPASTATPTKETGTPFKASPPRSPPNPFYEETDSSTPVIKSARRRSEPYPIEDTFAKFPKSSPLNRAESRKESTIEEAFAAARLLQQQQQNEKENGVTDSTSSFNRKNSLVPSRISRRSSRRGGTMNRKKAVAVPEFIQKSTRPNIRLTASNVRKKKMTLHRVEQSSVLVQLLNGQKVEVRCRTDIHAGEIFELVVAHANLNENALFGLSICNDGEHIFLDSTQRLEKFAPPAWKNERKAMTRAPFVLYLRFRYYPQSLDFVKTDVTMHELYLQLRKDILDNRLQPKKDTVFELAALALQAEFSDRPTIQNLEYFQLEHYLPKKFYAFEATNRLQNILSELHSHYTGMKAQDSEHRFIQICQAERDYGAHFHKVYRQKPGSNPNTDRFLPNTLWIAIMPRGIMVCEDQNDMRNIIEEHPWHKTQTLQFDKKRFVIAWYDDTEKVRQSVYYTEHYTKSSYFVRFSASQHRYMIKMRHMQATLGSEGRTGKNIDVAVDSQFNTLVTERKPKSIETQMSVETNMSSASKRPLQQISAEALNVSVPASDRTFSEPNNNETISDSFAQRLEEASISKDVTVEGMNHDAVLIDVHLQKHPQLGLGLTLVDGNLNGVKGVYVKSVAVGGAGEKQGLCVGDRLISVNGVSLVGQDRHFAVSLVKDSVDTVILRIQRLETVTSVLPVNGNSSPAMNNFKKTDTKNNAESNDVNATAHTFSENARMAKTPPAGRKAPEPQLHKRQRAVSDFGAIGDMLPVLNSEEIIADMRKNSRMNVDESSDEDEVQRGEYHLPVSAMYGFHGSDEDDVDDQGELSRESMEPKVASILEDRMDSVSWISGHMSRSTHGTTATGHGSAFWSTKKSNIDWTDEVTDSRGDSDITFSVRLHRNAQGSFGIQIASIEHQFYIKNVTAEPALSEDIRKQDRLLAVNGDRTENLTHDEVIDLLQSCGNTVVLSLQRHGNSLPQKKEETITAVLEKSTSGSLGLSLAKRTGTDGIFIRTIAPDSPASEEGSLRVGDRVWEVDGFNVADCDASTIVDRMRSASSTVEIVVKRFV